MPLTEKGEKIKSAMEENYGPEKGEEVFYASANKGTITGVDQEVVPLPLDPDLRGIAEGAQSNIVQQIYAEQAARNRNRPFLGGDMEDKPEDCNDKMPGADQEPAAGTTASATPPPPMMDSFGGVHDLATGLVTQPLPVPELEHPQLHPDASTPPEPACDGIFGSRDAAAGYGGVAGGVIPQGFDKVGDACPTGMSLQDICRGSEAFWGPQWKGTE
jgi:hypothetical protein